MSLGVWQIAIIAIVVLLLFGRGRISDVMGDFGKGIKSFKQGLNEDEKLKQPPRIENSSAQADTEKDSKPAGKSAD